MEANTRQFPPNAVLLFFLLLFSGSYAQDSPQLDSSHYYANVNQNAVTGSHVITVSCTYNGAIAFEILTPNVAFLSIGQFSGVISLAVDATTLELGNYTITLRCYDQNDLSQQDVSFLTISRIEENEFNPYFLHSNSLTISISESQDYVTDSFVVDINATDNDIGSFSSVSYAIEGPNTEPFSIEATSGVISLIASLDFESTDLYQFIVTASNPPVPGTGFVRSAEVFVVILVVDVNDREPQFGLSNYQFEIMEADLPTESFAQVQCSDADNTPDEITYGITITAQDPFIIDENNGELFLTQTLDYETQTSHSFEISCSDTGNVVFTSIASVVITVLPVNEFFPTASYDGSPTLSIFEGEPVGTSVPYGTITAEDGDSGPDGDIYFTVDESDDGAEFFEIDPQTGEMTLIKRIDLDSTGQSFDFLRLGITVCDTLPPRSGCPNVVNIVFFIFQAADEDPTFSEEVYQAFVPETTTPNTTVITASCTDADAVGTFGEFQSIDFVSPSQEILNSFSLDSTTGVIQTLVTLDYETQQSYSFQLRCIDSVSSQDLATVQIEVLAENDNQPEFEYQLYQFNVSQTAEPGPIGSVIASDMDLGFGSEIAYAIEFNEHFNITSAGVIELVRMLDSTTSGSQLVLTVQADDGSFIASTMVVVTITPGNLNPPQFVSGSIAIELSELTSIDTSVGSVFCNDSDSGVNAEISYAIIGGNTDGNFNINSLSGEITVKNSLVLPQNSLMETYQLLVECRDGGTPVLFDEIYVLLRVFQDNSSPPDIANSSITAFIAEDASINDLVTTVIVTDLDSSHIRFRFENESTPGAFLIDPSMGTVTVASALDREAIKEYTMIVVVSEVLQSLGPERSDQADLTIFIRDVNDNMPVCDTSGLVASIPESHPVGESVLLLSCTDSDSNENGALAYSLSNDFGILAFSNISGDIVLANPINEATPNTIVTMVTVSDMGDPPMAVIYQVTIFILQTNQYVPTIHNLPQTIILSEATSTQELIFTVQASDLDRGSNGQVSLLISSQSGDNPFIIFPNTGEIYLTQNLNFHHQAVYNLTVTATDGEFITSDTLTIQVQDENEYAPECDSAFYTAVIPEGIESSQMLVFISCFDNDEGTNGAIQYEIVEGNTGDAFEVLSNGSIWTLKALDYEDVMDYTLLVLVTDLGDPPLSFNVTVHITVQPVNEFAPIFDQSVYNKTVSEDFEVGAVILQVSAVDQDVSPDEVISYTLVGLADPIFSISRSGELQLASNLDRELVAFYSFIVQASDGGQPARSSLAQIEIAVSDIDDNPPQFTEDLYLAVLNSSTQVDTPVLEASCTDPDYGMNSSVRYFIVSSLDSQYFEIEPETGLISIKQILPTNRVYTFTISCASQGSSNFTDSAIVSVQVSVGHNITFYPLDLYNITVPEDFIAVSTLLHINASSVTGTDLVYSLLDEGTPFSIDANTGAFHLVASLDYETQISYVLQVQATDKGNPPNVGVALVQIQVANVNDEQPQILTIPSTLQLQEGPLGPVVVATYECNDADRGPEGQTSFVLISGDPQGVFSLSASGVLQVVGELDYETTQSYSLEIRCLDGGEPAREDTITVPISVEQVNEHGPVFPVPEYVFTIQENILPNTEIGDPIQATDADSPLHSDLTYSITDGPLTISPQSGQLILSQSLDFESVLSYEQSVSATDSGTLVFTSTVPVIVTVIDVNDNSPEFSASLYVGTIEETASLGDEVALSSAISCVDSDSGLNGETSVQITAGNVNDTFTVQSTEPYIITVEKALNFEDLQSYELTMVCLDSGNPQLVDETVVIISVVAINEFGPTFLNSPYMFELSEASSVGTEVGVIEAVDEDTGEHGDISYAFVNSTNVPFTIDPNTGSIRVTQSLDYETQPQLYILEAIASDSIMLSDDTTIIIQILNENDNSPIFTQNAYFASVSEDANPGTLVTLVTCTDADDFAAGVPVEYSFLQDSLPFSIDGGRILVSSVLDLEQVPIYTLQIRCSDSGGSTSQASVTIHIEPYNDFQPLFTGSLPYTLELTENQPLGVSIFQVTALDDDSVYNDITFNITSGNEESIFEIDPTSGIIVVNANIDREQQSFFMLGIEARNIIPPDDSTGSPSLFSDTTLSITVLDLNDNVPSIFPEQVTVFISQPNTVVAELVCSDPDLGQNGNTSLAISSENTASYFKIFENGSLLATEFLGIDAIVEITCSDNGNPPLSSIALITVSPTSMNDHQPNFPQSSYTLEVSEDVLVGQAIECYQATDSDGTETPDGIIKYSLTLLDTGTSRFSINTDTGCVFASIALDSTSQNEYRYSLTATDLGNPPLTGMAILLIIVNDAADSAPSFIGEPFTRIISEGVESETLIVSLTCTDPDINSNITYSIISGNDDDLFTVDSDLGIITIAQNQRLDYEQSTSHILSIACVDSLGLSDTAQVFVTVTPVNEFTPSFQAEAVSIPEQSIIGTVVIQLQWTDGDSGPDGEVEFQIVSGNTGGNFIITSSGQVLVGGELDRELIDFYALEIQITDLSANELNRRSTTNYVNITLSDINDNIPQLDMDVYTFGPLEGNEMPGFVVGTITCEDADAGMNSALSYQLIAESGMTSLFSIDTLNGIITVSGDLQSRDVDTLRMTVQCIDGGSVPLMSSAVVLVSIVEVNRLAPVFTNITYQVSVYEEIIVNSSLLIVLAEDSDAGAGGMVRYYLADSFDAQFFINESSGQLFLLGSLDYEMQQEYNLSVLAIDGADDSPIRLTSTTVVIVEVLPVNDHVPVCFSTQYSVIINETTQGEILDLMCSDADVGIDGELEYTITNSGSTGGLFVVDSEGSIIVPTSIPPNISSEEYSLFIVVSDSGSSAQTAEVVVAIMYSFEDLSPPMFNQSDYSFVIPESVSVGYIISTLTATDPDPGLQGRLTYSLKGTDTFEIVSNTGILYVSLPLDYETTLVEQFEVVAQDSDPVSPQSGSATVIVSVQNEDDTTPRCQQSFYEVEVLSSARVGDTILNLTCVDSDENGRLQFEESVGNKREVNPQFAVNETTGQVYVAGPLMPSTTNTIALLITDGSGETIEVTISIPVRFANTKPPMFHQIEYSFTVEEDAPLLSTVGTVQATDNDSSSLDLTFSIVNPGGIPEFYVHPATGEIVLVAPLDYEAQSVYFFTIRVEDSGSFDGSNKLSATASVIVNVGNINDNVPQLDNQVFGASITSDIQTGDSLIEITCTDIDSPPYGTPTLSITSITSQSPEDPLSGSGDGNLNGLFKLNAVTVEGQWSLVILQSLSQPGAYLINITCTDEGGLFSDGEVYVFVPEENSPQFSQPLYEWELSENAQVMSKYTDLEATTFNGSSVQYNITAGNEDGNFYIHPSTGVVSLIRGLDYETEVNYVLTITARDSSVRQSTSLLVVKVLDEHDQPPFFTSSITILQLQQNSIPGYPFGIVECIDASSLTRLNFTAMSDDVGIDQYGIVRVERMLAFTTAHVFTVTCYNVLTPELISTTTVVVEIISSNDYFPLFELDRYVFAVEEDIALFSNVGSVTATDRDADSYGKVTYTIISGDKDKFYIDSTSGIISTLSSLDYESSEDHYLVVEAHDGQSGMSIMNRRTATALVSIVVQDVNDITPVFSEPSYVQEIFTNHTVFSQVLAVDCMDPEQERNGRISYSLESDMESFIIQRNGTILLTRQQFDQITHNLRVICSDAGNASLSSAVSITIIVNSASPSPLLPVFERPHYQTSIQENLPVFTSLLQVTANLATSETTVMYSIESGNDNNYFHVDSTTGDLVIVESLFGTQQPIHTLVIRASTAVPTAFFSYATVQVEVISTQRDPLSFSSSFYLATISENAELFTPVTHTECNAQNMADTESVEYKIFSGNSAMIFNITDVGVIVVADTIDYEMQTIYTLTVTCGDGSLTDDQATVRIEILPQNEYIPEFSQSVYRFSAPENSIGLSIGQIQAVDGDEGSQGEITYQLLDPTTFSPIILEPSTGDLLIVGSLDYEQQASWEFVASARDIEGIESIAILKINVSNINDELPRIEPATAVAIVSSDSPPGYPLLSYECSDTDGSATSTSILSGNELGYFELNSLNQLVWTNNTNGLPSNIVVSMTLQCQDNDAPEQISLAYIAITIQQDVPIFPPMFSEDVYNISIPETTPIDSFVLKLSATGPNPEIVFDIYGAPDNLPFTVNASGAVHLTSSLDYETIPLYLFTVRATDTISGIFSLALVRVFVEDDNDVPPTILPAFHTIILPEDFETNTSVAIFVCRGEDASDIADITYQITSGNVNSSFTVSSTGSVQLIKSLDFETIDQYSLTITCSDGPDTSLSVNGTLVVMVTGVNEHAPAFVQDSYNFSVPEDSLAGDLVGNVLAVDGDRGVGEQVRYEIIGGSGESYFSINTDGDISTTTRSLNATAVPILELSISAIDPGSLSSSILAVIYVTDVNEPPILLVDTLAIITLLPLPSSTILEFTCYDTDIGQNANLTVDIAYNPSSLDVFLEAVSGMGVITSGVVINSTLPPGTHELGLRCTDSGNPPLHSNATAAIRVEGTNTQPVFTHGTLTLSVREDTPIGTFITSVNATDAESDIVYEITSGNGLGTFNINSSSGDIYLALSLNYEITTDYVISIFAHDFSPTNSLLASVKVVIFVENTNDNFPTLTPPGTQVITLSENTLPIADVANFACSDLDGSGISFSLTPSTGSPFGLTTQGQSTATVQLVQALDFEDQTVYSLSVTCVDSPIQSGGQTRQVSATLMIYITPENNHAPEFISPILFSLAEDTNIGQIVAQVQAVDPDNRTQVTYATVTHTNIFSIDQYSGDISLRQEVDFESTPTYNLLVLASDNDYTHDVQPMTAMAQVTMQITDVNDNFPECSTFVNSVTLHTGTYSYQSLYNVSCSDEDTGLNGVLSYSLNNDTFPSITNGRFVLNTSSGELGFTGTADISETVVVDITVTDSGEIPLSSVISIVVQIETSDADLPRFSPDVFNTTLSEDASSQSIVFEGIILQDALYNPTGNSVQFALHANPLFPSTFVIDSVTGNIVLSSTSSLDFDEGIQVYMLLVQASVGSYDTVAMVNVALTDFNDNPPIFDQSVYEGFILENGPRDEFVTQIEATDLDSGLNSEFRYSLVGTSLFNVDAITGIISTMRSLDREMTPIHSFHIIATDLGSPQLTGSALVTINVIDVNDNPPQFDSSLYTIAINSQSSPGVLATLSVSDLDTTLMTTFRIIADDQAVLELFSIESPSGILRQVTSISPELFASQYTFTVEVDDGQATDTTVVVINVSFITFTTILFEENIVGEVFSVYDFVQQQQLSLSSSVSFAIIDGNDDNSFAITEQDGVLMIVSALDRETIPEYNLTIRVTDTELPASINLTLVLIVSDQNDHAPVFSSAMYSFSITERLYTVPMLVGSVVATDLDEQRTINSFIQYSLIDSSSFFSIDQLTGEIFVQGNVDHELSSEVNIVVRANDLGEPSPQTSYANIVVGIEDINDNDPRFVPFDIVEFTVLAREGVQAGTQLNTIMGLLPGGSLVTLSMFEYTDPDSSSEIMSDLILLKGTNKYRLESLDGDMNKQVLVATSTLDQTDSGTKLQLIIRDEPENVEQFPVRKNITILVTPVLNTSPTATVTIATTDTPSNSFQAATIALVVIVILLLIVLIVLAVIVGIICLRSRRKQATYSVNRNAPSGGDAEVIALPPAYPLQREPHNEEPIVSEPEPVKVPLTFSQADPLEDYGHLPPDYSALNADTPDDDFFHPDHPLQGPVRAYDLQVGASQISTQSQSFQEVSTHF